MAVKTWKTASVSMDESCWSIRFTQEEEGVLVALHWKDKEVSSHETFLPQEEFNEALSDFIEK